MYMCRNSQLSVHVISIHQYNDTQSIYKMQTRATHKTNKNALLGQKRATVRYKYLAFILGVFSFRHLERLEQQ
jgi:hypothetical protein